MQEMNFLQSLHSSTKRDYLARMNSYKPECMRVAKQFCADYWDGDRKYGYGGYKYDGRWAFIARIMTRHYDLGKGQLILDIGCGKGHLLHEINAIGFECAGIDISIYAHENCKDEFRLGNCTKLPWPKEYFNFVYSINVLHNLGYKDLKKSIQEMVRVTKNKSYICVESYCNEEELCNLQCWALTCKSFYSPDDWLQIFEDNGYKGDYEFITFS